MPELKYSKYILSELKPEQRQHGLGKNPRFIVLSDNDIIEGCHFFSVMLMGEEATKIAGHGPHTHKTPEVLVALGTDVENPQELNAEIELCMGPEMEKHVITKSTLVYVPANFIHCPFRVLKVARPFSLYSGPIFREAHRDVVEEACLRGTQRQDDLHRRRRYSKRLREGVVE